MRCMISPRSLSAFSTAGTAAPLKRPIDPLSAGSAGGSSRVRARALPPAGGAQASAPRASAEPDRMLPRGSLLNLEV